MRLALFGLLALSACSSFEPSDERLPTRDQLLADFGRQVPDTGTGNVRERGGNARGSYDVTAFYTTYDTESPNPESRTFYVSLSPADGSIGGIGLSRPSVRATEVRVGDEFGVSALGTSSNRGSGQLYITAVDGDAISGVFAVDTQATNTLFTPDYRRITGTFTARPDSTI